MCAHCKTAQVETQLTDIGCAALWAKIQAGEPLVLVDALGPISYAGAHLPGAINLTPQTVDRLAPRRIPGLETEVVVYCAGPDCDSSLDVARRLVELGYRNVLHFSGGKEAWRAAGYPLEGGRV